MKRMISACLSMSLMLCGFAAPPAAFAQIVVAWTPSAEAPQIATALERKMWTGVDVKAVSFPSGREALEALLGGQADFAAAAELPAVVAAMRGQKFRIVSFLSRYRANRILYTAAIGLRSPADLAGRKVATTLGTNSNFALERELRKAGVKAEIVNAAPPDIVPALSRGDVDAALTFPSFTDQARRVLGDRYRELMTPGYVTHMVLLVSTDALEKKPQAVAAFVDGLVKADQLIAADPAAGQQAVEKATGGVLKLEALKINWPDYDYRMGLDGSLLKLMVEEGQWVRDRGLIKNVEPTEALFSAVFSEVPLKAIAPDRVRIP